MTISHRPVFATCVLYFHTLPLLPSCPASEALFPGLRISASLLFPNDAACHIQWRACTKQLPSSCHFSSRRRALTPDEQSNAFRPNMVTEPRGSKQWCCCRRCHTKVPVAETQPEAETDEDLVDRWEHITTQLRLLGRRRRIWAMTGHQLQEIKRRGQEDGVRQRRNSLSASSSRATVSRSR